MEWLPLSSTTVDMERWASGGIIFGTSLGHISTSELRRTINGGNYHVSQAHRGDGRWHHEKGNSLETLCEALPQCACYFFGAKG